MFCADMSSHARRNTSRQLRGGSSLGAFARRDRDFLLDKMLELLFDGCSAIPTRSSTTGTIPTASHALGILPGRKRAKQPRLLAVNIDQAILKTTSLSYHGPPA